ncbi:MAG: hypothetical protein IJF00_00605 [Bacteroidaceae bacterium]|nr:hypothetical protein [Bacteroidaceae bacterium]
MRTKPKEIIIGSIAVAASAMPITWLLQYFFQDKHPSLYYIPDFFIFVITLAVIEFIASYLKNKKNKRSAKTTGNSCKPV